MCRSIEQGGRRCSGHLQEARSKLGGKLGREGFEAVPLKADENREELEQEFADIERELAYREAARERLIARRGAARHNAAEAERQWKRDVELMKADGGDGVVNIETSDDEWDSFEKAAADAELSTVSRWARLVLADVVESEDEEQLTEDALTLNSYAHGAGLKRHKLRLYSMRGAIDSKRGDVEQRDYVRAHLLKAVAEQQ